MHEQFHSTGRELAQFVAKAVDGLLVLEVNPSSSQIIG